MPRASEGDRLLAFLATRDLACPGCGYNLRGLATPRCPECGRAISPADLVPLGFHAARDRSLFGTASLIGFAGVATQAAGIIAGVSIGRAPELVTGLVCPATTGLLLALVALGGIGPAARPTLGRERPLAGAGVLQALLAALSWALAILILVLVLA